MCRSTGKIEIACLFRSIKAMKNVGWVTANLHHGAAHHYDPNKVQFNDFAGFREFVRGNSLPSHLCLC